MNYFDTVDPYGLTGLWKPIDRDNSVVLNLNKTTYALLNSYEELIDHGVYMVRESSIVFYSTLSGVTRVSPRPNPLMHLDSVLLKKI